jgi:heat shock protein HslJ
MLRVSGCRVSRAVIVHGRIARMIRHRSLATLLAVTLLTLVAGATSAQPSAEAPLITPEDIEWKLTGYARAGTVVAVPFGIAATLMLTSGVASGSGGCNTFSGTYTLSGSSLTFGDEISRTLALCTTAGVQTVEDAYMAALPNVAGWAGTSTSLTLTDVSGQTLLTFEVPGVGLTTSELTSLMTTLQSLQAGIASLREEVQRLNVDRLRERVRTLETTAEELGDQVANLEETGNGRSQGNGFTQAEGVLLEGIPTRIASRCVPLRAGLPKGTEAAVRCTPETAAVTTLDYFLLDGEDAAAAFSSTMTTFNVPEAVSDTQTCEFGVKSQRVFLGNGWQSEGCYRTGGHAEVRFVDNATDCRQLRVNQRRLESPAFYMALQGTTGDVEAVHAWATRNLTDASSQITSITQPIERPGQARSPICPS